MSSSGSVKKALTAAAALVTMAALAPPSAAAATTLYVAPNGKDSAAGTQADPTTLPSALGRITAGGTISLRGGTYSYAQTVTITPANNTPLNSRPSAFSPAIAGLTISAMMRASISGVATGAGE